MRDYSVLVGNGVNNITDGNSWQDVLHELGDAYDVTINTNEKPFPLAYEEIYFNILHRQVDGFSERDVKKAIAKKIKLIKPNNIHSRIIELDCTNILTTNYDLAFESCLDEGLNFEGLKNEGRINETKYNIFRYHKVGEKNIWHIHGALNVPESIILGYEHYSGYLQNMRSYTATGSKYKDEFFNEPLVKRFGAGSLNYSWIDHFFTRDIYILGLSLDFVEIDIWWLLTFRERIKFDKKFSLDNELTYYIPRCFYNNPKSKPKIDLLKSVGVKVNCDFGTDFFGNEEGYYLSVIDDIHQRNNR